MTKLRELERDALEQANQLKVLEQQKTDVANKMLGYVNHELRNPLQGIMGIAELSLGDLKQLQVAEPQMQKKKKIHNNIYTLIKTTEFMKHIIDDILDIRKLEENMVDINIEKLSVQSILKSTFKSVKSKIQEKKGVVEFASYINGELCSLMERESGEDFENTIYIESDKFRIQQILTNLLTNAFKYTSHGHVHFKVTVHEADPDITFAVVDTGRGIPNEKKAKIFSPFSQTNPSDASRYGGIGLGLYLCKMLTSLLKGTIGFESIYERNERNEENPEHGSIFWVKLPKTFSPPTGMTLIQ